STTSTWSGGCGAYPCANGLAAWLSMPKERFLDWAARRSLILLSSSLIRRAVLSGSAPTSATHSSPSCGAQCGSQRTQFQLCAASPSALSTTISKSRGLCSAAAWATSQRASARETGRRPVTPSTPTSGSGTVTGTACDTGTGGSSLASTP